MQIIPCFDNVHDILIKNTPDVWFEQPSLHMKPANPLTVEMEVHTPSCFILIPCLVFHFYLLSQMTASGPFSQSGLPVLPLELVLTSLASCLLHMASCAWYWPILYANSVFLS